MSTTFCLVMIVRDEAPIITRCLTSVKALLDSFVIMDTGSVDGTPSIINEWAKENNIEGEVIHEEWKNYGYNKTKVIQYAHEKYPEASYLFFLDADEVFITDPNNPESYLTKDDRVNLEMVLDWQPEFDIFQFTTLYGNLKYRRWQLVRNNQPYVWKQPVHEYLEGINSSNTKHIDWIYNLARKQGNSSRNPDRYKHDAKMFLEFLEENPDEPRAVFYLAQSYDSYGDQESALKWYKSRTEIMTGFYQERYIACLRIGRISKDEAEKMMYLTQGYTICPHRLECIYELMMIQYRKGNHVATVAYGLLAPCDGSNSERSSVSSDLFVEANIYDYQFDFDFAISCYYAKEHKRGIEANHRAKRKAPQHIKNRIDANLTFFPATETPTPALVEAPYNPSATMNIIVIDNFYANPDEVRKVALEQTYDVKGNYPGARTDCIKEYWTSAKKRFEQILQRKITYWPDGYNASFQYATKDKRSWLHRDATEFSAIVYLTPDAPVDSGTKFYRHKALSLEEKPDEDTEKLLNLDTYKPDAWDLVDQTGNRYNRCVIFRGKRTHISGDYFGDSLENGRLFQMFFFN